MRTYSKVELHAMIAALREEISQKENEVKEMKSVFREFIIRAGFSFPETPEEVQQFEEGVKDKHELFLKIADLLGFGMPEEDISSLH